MHTPEQVPSKVPAYLRPANLGLVFAGGAVGVLVREALMLGVPDLVCMPMAVLLANLIGAFLLGLLLEALAVRAPETSRHRALRLLLGTGMLGGFTTYSALAQTVALLGIGGAAGIAFAYGLGTVVLGGLAAWLGIPVGGALGRRGRSVAEPLAAPPAAVEGSEAGSDNA